jgi:enoyl-CoA hydratase
MTDTLVSYECSEGIADIRMDDGKANVMSEAMLRALHAAFDRAEADRAVVMLSGRERMFSGGYDLKMFTQPQEVIGRILRLGAELVARIAGFPTPVLMVCAGHAVAQGAFTLLAGDVRFGTAGPFKLGLNEVAIGMIIPHYGVEIARMRLNASWFNHATLTGAMYSPDEAVRAGFLDAVFPAADLMARAREEAARLRSLNMPAYVGTKQRVRGPALAKLREGIDQELPALT